MKTFGSAFIGFFLLAFCLTFQSCKSEPKTLKNPETQKEDAEPESPEPEALVEMPQIPIEERAFTYEGTIKGSIPVFLHFTEIDDVLSGEITYMNTKAKKPIRIIGEIMMNGGSKEKDYYRILEFSDDGFITGILSLVKEGDRMSGKWYFGGNDSDFEMNISKSDSIVRRVDFTAEPSKAFGTYAYSYTKDEGNTGDFSISKKNDKESLFEIIGVHSAPGYNIASIEECTVPFNGKTDEFDFLIPNEETCNFKVKFYKDFASVHYSNGNCNVGYFGHNATVEGLFLKMK